MLCKKPYTKGVLKFGCGQCMPCRFNLRRLKTHRIMLEQRSHKQCSFITLTYRDEDLPPGGTLVPEHYQLWLKKLRRRVAPARLRFLLVGEYGDKNERPHYHAALFGFPPCQYAPGDSQSAIYERRTCSCIPCETIRSTWGLGNTDCGSLTRHSASYIGGYVEKKLTSAKDPRLNGRYPEFSRSSLKPGIGATAIEEIARFCTSEFGVNDILETGDVPMGLEHGGKKYPLGRYLLKKLRSHLGYRETLHEEKMQKLQTKTIVEKHLDWAEGRLQGKKDWEVDKQKRLSDLQKIRNMEAKFNLNTRKKL